MSKASNFFVIPVEPEVSYSVIQHAVNLRILESVLILTIKGRKGDKELKHVIIIAASRDTLKKVLRAKFQKLREEGYSFGMYRNVDDLIAYIDKEYKKTKFIF